MNNKTRQKVKNTRRFAILWTVGSFFIGGYFSRHYQNRLQACPEGQFKQNNTCNSIIRECKHHLGGIGVEKRDEEKQKYGSCQACLSAKECK